MEFGQATNRLLRQMKSAETVEQIMRAADLNRCEAVAGIIQTVANGFLDEGLTTGQQAQQLSDWSKHIRQRTAEADLSSPEYSEQSETLSGIHKGVRREMRRRYGEIEREPIPGTTTVEG